MWISYHCRLIFLALHCTGYFSVYLQCLCFVKMFLQWKSSIQSTFLWEPCSLLVTLLKGKLLKMYYKAASVPCFILSHHETFKKMGMHYVKYRWKTLSKVRRTHASKSASCTLLPQLKCLVKFYIESKILLGILSLDKTLLKQTCYWFMHNIMAFNPP